MKTLKVILLSAIIGGLMGGGSAWVVVKNVSRQKQKLTPQKLIEEFYLIENAVHVSPHSLRRKMDRGEQDFILVDLRSAQEYEKEHVIGAVNVPAYRDPNTPAYEEKERIINAFKALPTGKDIVVYCYSIPCMTGRKIGKMLAENGIYVKHLGIGWNEWRYFWKLWNHELEWETTKPEDYVWKGKEPGVPPRRELPNPCGEGELSC